MMAERERFNNLFPINNRNFCTTHAMTTSRMRLKIGQVMKKEIITIAGDEAVATAAVMMAENNVSCIIVVDKGNVTGILTETDLLKKVVVEVFLYGEVQKIGDKSFKVFGDFKEVNFFEHEHF